MAEVTLIDVAQPFINLLGGIAGLTLAYAIVMLWQNKRKLQRLERIEQALEQSKRRDHELRRTQRTIMNYLEAQEQWMASKTKR